MNPTAPLRRVLLIVGDRECRKILGEVLDEFPQTLLTTVYSAGEARILLNAYRYDLVIATNLGVAPWPSLDVIPAERTYPAMFISGHWDDDLVRICGERRVLPVRAPFSIEALRASITEAFATDRPIG